MKKLSLILTMVGLAFFISCEKEITSLEGTVWSAKTEIGHDEGHNEIELTFTATQATITQTFSWGGTSTFTGTYTFDPPIVLISGDMWNSDELPLEMPYGMVHRGTVKGHSMEIHIQETCDMIMITTLEKQ